MHNFEKSVPFDPGFSAISFSFTENIERATYEYSVLKAPHQKKFWLLKHEPVLVEFIEKSAAFYWGCILWGSFINQRFKDSPKKITGNNTEGLSDEEIKNLDCAVEVKSILQYIENFDRDCKYFLKKPARISAKIKDILNNYIEFAALNNNFIGIDTTDKIKLPKIAQGVQKMTDKQLDELCEKIYAAISSNKIEKLIEIDL